MRKSLIALAILSSTQAFAVDLIIQGNRTLVQNKGTLAEQEFELVDPYTIRVSDIIDSNIPETFSFKIDKQYSNNIVYDTRTLFNNFENRYALYEFLSNKIGQEIAFQKKDQEKQLATIHKIVGSNIFLKNDKDEVILVELEDLILSSDFFKSEDFNLITFFKEPVKNNAKYEYSYFANNFSWNPSYTLFLKDNKEKTIDFNFYGKVKNDSNTELNDINLTLMTQGDFQQLPIYYRLSPLRSSHFEPIGDIYPRGYGYNQKRVYAKSNLTQDVLLEDNSMAFSSSEGFNRIEGVTAVNVGDLSAYKIDNKVNLYPKIVSNILIKDFKDLKYTKNNYVELNRISNPYNILSNKRTGINKTTVLMTKEDNEQLKDYYIPRGNIQLLLEEDGLNYPYVNVSIPAIKNQDLEIPLPLNKNVEFYSKVKSKSDVTLINKRVTGKQKVYAKKSDSKIEMEVRIAKAKAAKLGKTYHRDPMDDLYVESKKDIFEYKYKVRSVQYFKNKSDKEQRFVFVVPNNEYLEGLEFDSRYKKELVKDKDVYKFSFTLKGNEEAELFSEQWFYTNKEVKFL